MGALSDGEYGTIRLAGSWRSVGVVAVAAVMIVNMNRGDLLGCNGRRLLKKMVHPMGSGKCQKE